MIIAVDFDGTLVEHRYPEIGKEILFAFETLRELQKQKHQIILWTLRSGNELDEALEFCRQRGVEFYAVNKSFPEEIFTESSSRKINADIFIDDRNIGGLPGWGEIWHMLNPGENPGIKEELRRLPKNRRSVIYRIKKLFT
jgi:phosphatidylserine/phosphatidylglycerophosphate/cardiolipin synthase-like enzyme